MGVLDTGYTFQNNDVITSTRMNDIIDQTTFTSDALVSGNNTLLVVGGKLQVNASGINSNELAPNSVTSDKIVDGTIVNADINASADISGSKLADNSTSGVKITDASITAPKLDGAQTGTAPIFGVRSWVAYDPGTPISPEFAGTYSRSGTTVTVIAAGHGLKTGSLVYLNFTSGAATDGDFIITSVSTTTVANDTFTVTHGTSGTTSGNVGIPRATIIGSGNVSSVTLISTGVQVVNFTTEMPSVNYVAVASPEGFASGSVNLSCDIVSKYIGSCQIRSQNSNGLDNSQKTNVMVIG